MKKKNNNLNYFNNEKQDNFVADFGFMPPHRTITKCKNPVFMDKYLHRIAIMKKEHLGNVGDREESGLPGWVSQFVCTGCGKKYTVNYSTGFFHPDRA